MEFNLIAGETISGKLIFTLKAIFIDKRIPTVNVYQFMNMDHEKRIQKE